jgi:hypothetical protein
MSRGALGFSPAAYEALGSPAAVVYLTDRDERLIGFRPASPEEPNAHKVSRAARTTSARALLRFMGAEYAQSRRYPLLTDDGTPHIDLKQPGTPVTSNRAKSRSTS